MFKYGTACYPIVWQANMYINVFKIYSLFITLTSDKVCTCNYRVTLDAFIRHIDVYIFMYIYNVIILKILGNINKYVMAFLWLFMAYFNNNTKIQNTNV